MRPLLYGRRASRLVEYVRVRSHSSWLPLLAFLLLAGCWHVPPEIGTSSFQLVEPTPAPPTAADEAKVTQPAIHAQYLGAVVEQKSIVLPVYPARALAAKAGTAQVRLTVVVDVSGQVADVRPTLLASPHGPGDFEEEFRAAVVTAVRQWRFLPAKVEYFETVVQEDFSYDRVVRTDLKKSELEFAFTFSAKRKLEEGAAAK